MQGTERSDEKESAACDTVAAAYHVTAVATAQENSLSLLKYKVIAEHVRGRHRLTVFLITAGTDPFCLQACLKCTQTHS
jgi:hypothetical protein